MLMVTTIIILITTTTTTTTTTTATTRGSSTTTATTICVIYIMKIDLSCFTFCLVNWTKCKVNPVNQLVNLVV